MTFKVVLEPGEDGWIVAECPALPGCVSQGRTEEEAIENIREANHLWLDTEVEEQTGSLPANARILEVTVGWPDCPSSRERTPSAPSSEPDGGAPGRKAVTFPL
jgi:predicted RNase H-like HicB family nuclease